MIVNLLTEHQLECFSSKGGCVKMPHCWKSHALAHIISHELVSIYKPRVTRTKDRLAFLLFFYMLALHFIFSLLFFPLTVSFKQSIVTTHGLRSYRIHSLYTLCHLAVPRRCSRRGLSLFCCIFNGKHV